MYQNVEPRREASGGGGFQHCHSSYDNLGQSWSYFNRYSRRYSILHRTMCHFKAAARLAAATYRDSSPSHRKLSVNAFYERIRLLRAYPGSPAQ
jgi:hypothetical protein